MNILLFFCACFMTFNLFADQGFYKPVSSPHEVVNKYSNSVGMVIVSANSIDGYSAGSGFVYKIQNEYAYLITNYHVVKERCKEIGKSCSGLHIRFGYIWDEAKKDFVVNHDNTFKGVFKEITLSYSNPERDMAVIKFKIGLFKFPAVDLISKIEDLPQDGPYISIGYPIQSLRTGVKGTVEQVWSEGMIQGIATNAELDSGVKGTLLLHNIDLIPGMSGGPIFHSSGKFVGIQQGVALKTEGAYTFENIDLMIAIPFDDFDPKL